MAYLDRISMSPLRSEVVQIMNEFLIKQGLNPQSPTRLGSTAKQALEQARDRVAGLICADPKDMVFTSTGTDSVNLAIRGLARSAIRSKSQRRILVSAIEHVSVLNTVRSMEKEGFETCVIPVDSRGVIDIEAFKNEIDAGALLVSVQMANPEIGTTQDIKTLATYATEKGVLFHTDAVDAAGWLPIDVNDLKVDALSFSGTQFGGPPGAAALYIRKGVSIVPMLTGGIQERHRRPGLENIPAIAGFGIASEHAAATIEDRSLKARRLETQLRVALMALKDVIMTGHPEHRVPGHVSALVRYVEGEALLLMLDMKNIQAASGSSCTAKDLKISPVLMALGIEHADAQGSLVFTICEDTTEDDIRYVIEVLPPIIDRLRAMSPLWPR